MDEKELAEHIENAIMILASNKNPNFKDIQIGDCINCRKKRAAEKKLFCSADCAIDFKNKRE